MTDADGGAPLSRSTPDSPAVAVIVARDGRLPYGWAPAVAEAGGHAVVVGSGVGPETAAAIEGARLVHWAETVTDPGRLAAQLAPSLAGCRLVILPASPDGRDLAPRLAACLARPLLAGAARLAVDGERLEADLLRIDGRILVAVTMAGSAVATLWPGPPAPSPPGAATAQPDAVVRALAVGPPAPGPGSVRSVALVEPDPATMDLSDAHRVLAGGAGLVPAGSDDRVGRAVFALLTEVAAALGASAGATRVVTDAGWAGYDRQIGTTGVTLQPDLYVALGISGASQHIGGIGDPECVVSVNLDPSCPMTGLAELGLVTDATGLLVELAHRLDVAVPDQLKELEAWTELKELQG